MVRIFVDYENIPYKWEDLIEFIKDQFTIYLVAPKDVEICVNINKLDKLHNNKLIKIPGIKGEKNSLDIQLSSTLGSVISMYPDDRFFIVSDDKIFRNLADFWRNFNDTHIGIITTEILNGISKYNKLLEDVA